MIKIRPLSIVLTFFCIFAISVYADHAQKALNYSEKKLWGKAISQANKHKDPVLRKIIYSKQFQDTSYKNDFREVADFIENNKDWPQIEKIKEALESYIDDNTNKRAIIKYFTQNSPLTSSGYQYYAKALTETLAQDKRPKNIIKLGWIYGDFTEEEQREFLHKNSHIIDIDEHIKKLDYLLWEKNLDAAKRILPLAGPKAKAFYDAHIAFIKNKKNKNRYYRKVPVEYRYESRLLYRYLSQYTTYDKIPTSAAHSIIKAPYDPFLHTQWWRMKNLFARNMVQRKRYMLAYKIASSGKSGNNYAAAQSEWLSGWVALKYLKKLPKAYEHFETLHSRVKMPMTRSRAAYWLGITAKALGNKDKAHSMLQEAAAFNFTFYGQMAMIEMGLTNFTLPPSPKITKAARKFYAKNEFARATNLLIKHRKINDARLYGKAAISRAKNYGEAALIVSSISSSDNLFYKIELAKAAAQKGYLLIADNHPTPYKLGHFKHVDPALVYAVIMKESAFDHKAISHANAHGLMQLIPETGCEMQKKINQRCSVRRLTSDPRHNIRLGANHLADLLEYYNGSYILMAAAYNAGSEPVDSWIKRNGDPRKYKNLNKIIEWMESIPYYETRDYVQRIFEYLQIYKELLYQKSTLELKSDLFKGSTRK